MNYDINDGGFGVRYQKKMSETGRVGMLLADDQVSKNNSTNQVLSVDIGK